MDKITNQITMLGTGNATVSQIYNTCFLLKTSSTLMLVDAGGGNGILSQLKKVNVQISDIHHLFVTHAHTDHVLGVIWVIRMVAQCKGYEGLLHVYGNDKVMKVIKTIIDMILAKKQLAKVAERVVFHQLEDGDCFEVGDMKLECFDIQSTKEKQFGFRAELPSSDESGKPLVLACLGDEPYNEANYEYVKGSSWLLHEAFCLYAEADKFKPYEKHHSTVKEACQLAEELGVPNLLLYHTEETHLKERKELYTAEGQEYYHGNLYVPDDMEEFIICT